MESYPPQVSELYVVSDIHMGGRKDGQVDFQIFNRGERLGAFIRYVAEQRPGEEVALVLNGDIVDSLAEEEVPSYIALDAVTARQMMERIYADASFKPVWDALAAFVAKEKRRLVFVVGNHDIELSLPVVEDSIRRRLAGDSVEAAARIHFSTHGGGFTCLVGPSRVFCTHGNELDPWNWVDYSALGQLANALNAGRSVSPQKWKPNAGTRMVVDVMNEIKRRYPFVDLLKPETAAAASVLMVLDKELVKKVDLSDAFPILRDKRAGEKVTSELLGAYAAMPHAASATPVTADELADGLLGPNLKQAVASAGTGAGGGRSEDQLLLDAELGRDSGVEGVEEVPETLGVWDMVAGRVGLVSPQEGLRRALQDWLEDDTTFDFDHQDDLFKNMEKRVADSVDFVITGHTHLARALTYSGGCHYYNCGTWIRTLRLTRQALEDKAFFNDQLWGALTSGRMSDLDNAKIPGPQGDVNLLLDRTTAVRIAAQGGKAVGDLLQVTEDGGALTVQQQPGTASLQAR